MRNKHNEGVFFILNVLSLYLFKICFFIYIFVFSLSESFWNGGPVYRLITCSWHLWCPKWKRQSKVYCSYKGQCLKFLFSFIFIYFKNLFWQISYSSLQTNLLSTFTCLNIFYVLFVCVCVCVCARARAYIYIYICVCVRIIFPFNLLLFWEPLCVSFDTFKDYM